MLGIITSRLQPNVDVNVNIPVTHTWYLVLLTVVVDVNMDDKRKRQRQRTPPRARAVPFIITPPKKKGRSGRSSKRRRNPGDSTDDIPAIGEAGKRDRSTPPPNPSSSGKGVGDTSDARAGNGKSSVPEDREYGDGGGGGSGATPLFSGFLETLKANVESAEATEAARFELEQAAVAHLEVCVCGWVWVVCFVLFWLLSYDRSLRFFFVCFTVLP